jgi:hypothetical protein
MNPKTIVKIISALVAAAGGVLSIADVITAIPSLPPYVVNAWPLVFLAATLIDRVGIAIVNSLQGKDGPK